MDGNPVLTISAPQGSLQTTHHASDMAHGPAVSISVRTMVLNQGEVVSIEGPSMTVTVSRQGADLTLHMVAPRGMFGDVHGIIGRSLQQQERPLANVLQQTVFTAAEDYQVSGPFGNNFGGNEFHSVGLVL